MAGTTLVKAKQALVDVLKARSECIGVDVDYAFNGDRGAESIWLGDTRGDVSISNLRAGRKLRDEDYVIDVLISVLGDGNTQFESDTRAAELLTALDEALADDPYLTIPDLIVSAGLESWEQRTAVTDSGRDCGFIAKVRVKARVL